MSFSQQCKGLFKLANLLARKSQKLGVASFVGLKKKIHFIGLCIHIIKNSIMVIQKISSSPYFIFITLFYDIVKNYTFNLFNKELEKPVPLTGTGSGTELVRRYIWNLFLEFRRIECPIYIDPTGLTEPWNLRPVGKQNRTEPNRSVLVGLGRFTFG